MDIPVSSCNAVRQWLEQALPLSEPTQLPTQLVAHISACARCQGALLTLVATPHTSVLVGDGACSSCQNDLPAFLEEEREHDTILAAQLYPDVWLHLWLCSEYAEIAEMIRAVIQGQTTVVSRIHQGVLQLFRLPRAFLAAAMPFPASLAGATRGSRRGVQILVEEQVEELTASFGVMLQRDEAWQIVISTEPPIAGDIAIMSGDLRLTVTVDSTGSAVFANIPDKAFRGFDGPDFEITLKK